MKRANFKHRKEARQGAAYIRRELRKKRSAQEQIHKLDRRLGACNGAAKERARLREEIRS